MIPYINALKIWNAGRGMWCLPRKGSEEYQQVQNVRFGRKPEREQREREQMAMEDINIKPKQPKVVKVKLPKETKPKPRRMEIVEEDMFEEVKKQVKKELEEGVVSSEYDLGWKPETTEKIISGGKRLYQLEEYRFITGETNAKDIVLKKLEDVEGPKKERARELLTRVKDWKPQDRYYTNSRVYNTKIKSTKTTIDEGTQKALDDYQEFADELNKTRGNPIRTIYYRSVFHPDGKTTLEVHWEITRNLKEGKTISYPHYIRHYETQPVFKVLPDSMTIKKIKEEEEKEQKQKEEKRKAKEEDPVMKLKVQIEELEADNRELLGKMRPHREVLKTKGPNSNEYKQAKDELNRLIDEQTKKNTQIFKLEDEIKKIKREKAKQQKQKLEASEEGKKIKELEKEIEDLRKLFYKDKMKYDEYERRRDEKEKEIKALKKALKK